MDKIIKGCLACGCIFDDDECPFCAKEKEWDKIHEFAEWVLKILEYDNN